MRRGSASGLFFLRGTGIALYALFIQLASADESYQQTLIQEVQSRSQLSMDPQPQGKIIEKVIIASHDVIDERDPWPLFLNAVHSTTREDVIRRELLFAEGEPWSDRLILESERNLRKNLFVSIARVVACRSQDDGHVVVLVVTKDLWSLRVNTDFSYVGSTLESLEVQLEEANVAGRTKDIALDYSLDLATHSVGENFTDPRVLGSRVAFGQSARFIVNRDSRKLEGGSGGLSIGQPLYRIDAPWGWRIAATSSKDIYRLFSGPKLAQFTSTSGQFYPYRFGRRRSDFLAQLTRSYGSGWKHDFSGGWKGWIKSFELLGSDAAVAAAATRSEFSAQALPRTESAGMLFAAYQTYSTSFDRKVDVQTFALTEDYRLGPSLGFEVRAARPGLGFSSQFEEFALSLGWTAFYEENLFFAGLTGSVRHQRGVQSRTDWVNRIGAFSVKNVSPPIFGFRLHAGARISRRAYDLDRGFSVLGGDNALRGFPSRYFSGTQSWGANAELRSRSMALQTVHLGYAFFYDAGDALNSWSDLGVHQSVGAGLRIVFPQFNTSVLRLDVAMPLEKIAGADPAYFSAQFGQAF